MTQLECRLSTGLISARIRSAAVAVFLLLAGGNFAEIYGQAYGGPTLLSRGGNRPGRRGRAPLDFNVYAGVRGLVETGLIAPQLNLTGQIEPITSTGYSLESGVFGARDWRNTSFGIDYRFDYRDGNVSYYNGANHALSIDLAHRLTRRINVGFRQIAGTSKRGFSGFAGPGFGGLDTLGVPLLEVFDSRFYYVQSSVFAGYRRSARSQFQAGADAFFVKRTNLSLINMQGYRFGGAYDYLLSRRTRVGVQMDYIFFDYPRAFSGSKTQMVQGVVVRSVTRNLQLSGRAGVARIASFGINQVQLSPEVAEILGRPVGLVAFDSASLGAVVNLTASYTQERGRFYASLDNGVDPGNGVLLASRRTSATAGYSYSGLRRFSLGLSAGYSRYSSASIQVGGMSSFQGGGGFSYMMARSINIVGQAELRTFSVSANDLQPREGASVSLGIAYSPSRFPLPIW